MLYAELCGRTLAHAHGKSGDAATIMGYLGKSDTFDQAIGDFVLAYAGQNAKMPRGAGGGGESGRLKST